MAVEHKYEPKLSTRERVLELTRNTEPYDPKKDPDRYRSDIFESDEELEAFIAEIYAERRKHLA